MKTLRNYALAMLAIVAFCIGTDPARAQTIEVRSLLSDTGWHAVGGGVQAHQPTLEYQPPMVSVWERSARPVPAGTAGLNPYGQWTYVQVVMNCSTWSQVPVAVLGDDRRVMLIAEVTGQAPVARWPNEGTIPYRTMTAVCALYGYERRPLDGRPMATAHPDGTPFVGGIKQLDKP